MPTYYVLSVLLSTTTAALNCYNCKAETIYYLTPSRKSLLILGPKDPVSKQWCSKKAEQRKQMIENYENFPKLKENFKLKGPTHQMLNTIKEKAPDIVHH